MAKVKERKSESWKPGLFHDDGFISKNKKRKDKRMSLNLSAKKIDTDEFIPIKKSALALAKTKDNLKSTPNKFLSPVLDKKNTPKKKDTPLPVSGSKKQNKTFSTPDSRKLSLADTLSAASRKLNGTPKSKADADTPKKSKEAAGTPKSKPELVKNGKAVSEPVIKSSLKKKAQKFIDHEAEEGEEPVTSKEVKPYVKGQKRKSISFKFDKEDSDSESDESDGLEDISGPQSFLDEEASEGEETDESDSDQSDVDDEDDGEDSDTFKSFLSGESDDDESGDEEVSDEESTGIESGSDIEDEEGSDVDDEDDDSDEEDSDDSDAENQPQVLAKKTAAGSQNKKNDVKNLNGDIDQKQLKKSKKSDIKAESKPVPVAVIPPNQVKKEKVEKSQKVIENVAKKIKVDVNVDQKTNTEAKKSKKKDASAAETSDYAGFIKHLPSTITSEQIKDTLSPVISAENIVSVVLKKNNKKKSNRCFVYVSNEDSLDNLENKVYTIGTHKFKIFKARESKKVVCTKPLVFLPRVPLSINDDTVKKVIESDIGAGNVLCVKRKKENVALKTRNLVIELPSEEIMKKVLLKGSYSYKGSDIIVRQAFESGLNIPLYRAVFADIPENTTEAALKKAVESKLGQGTVLMAKFSFRKKTFAFVNLNSAESLNKLLDPGTKIVVNNATLRTLEFKPRLPGSKRGPAKKKDAETPAAKKQKVDESSPEPKSKKFKKGKGPGNQPNSPQKSQPPKSVQNTPKQKNKGLNQSQSNAQNSPKKPNQQQNSPSSPPKNKKAKNQVPDKKSNLNAKLEAKKNKLKNKKNKKQADTSD